MNIQSNRNTAHLTINRFNEYFLEIKDESFTLFPTSFTDNITSETTSISLSATYECINLPVYFKWFVVVSLFLFEICQMNLIVLISRKQYTILMRLLGYI
jgi:hypothetical protein